MRRRFKVIKLPDDPGEEEQLPRRYLFAIGTEIKRVNDHGASSKDLLRLLRFDDGHKEVFWPEELDPR